VTIYPGPLPQKRVPPRTLPGSIERHRDVCRKNPSSDLSSSSSQEQELQSPVKELKSPTIHSSNGFILKNDDFIKRPKSPRSASVSPSNATSYGIKISIQTMDNLMNNRNAIHKSKIDQKMNMKNNKRNSRLSDNEDDEDKFSDDSLEDTSLPPPAPPPVIPPPPSLSAPVTPSKRHSIAWEVNLDDLCSSGNANGIAAKVNFTLFYYHSLLSAAILSSRSRWGFSNEEGKKICESSSFRHISSFIRFIDIITRVG
jgi:hypothetical protein